MSAAPPAFVIVGRVRNAHGLRGELVVESLTDRPGVVFAPGRRLFAGTARGTVAPDHRELKILHAKPFKGGWIIAFDTIRDRTAADLWRDRFFLVPDDEAQPLEEGEVYLHELHGMRVNLASGEAVGTVLNVFELPQGLMLEVARAGSTTVMIPYSRVVTAVDRAAKIISIDPPLGLLD